MLSGHELGGKDKKGKLFDPPITVMFKGDDQGAKEKKERTVNAAEALKVPIEVGEMVRVLYPDGTYYWTKRYWEALTPELAERAKRILPKIREMYLRTEEEWLYGFLFDYDPALEIGIWERRAENYQRLSRGKSPRNRKKIWKAIAGAPPYVIINPHN